MYYPRCEFFGFIVDKDGNVYYLSGRRNEVEDLDCFTTISEKFKLSDDVWRYVLKCNEDDTLRWKDNPPSIDELTARLKLDYGLSESDMPLAVSERMKEQLLEVAPKLYEFRRFDFHFDIPEIDESLIYEYPIEIPPYLVANYLIRCGYGYSCKYDYFSTEVDDPTIIDNCNPIIIYNRVTKPSKKLFVYAFLNYSYTGFDKNDNPVRVEEKRVIIKNIDGIKIYN